MHELELTPRKVEATVGDLFSDLPEPSSLDCPEYRNFDLVTVGAAIRHFHPAQNAARILGQLLKSSGVLFIQDVYVSEKDKGHRHHGFGEDVMRELMEKAGCQMSSPRSCPET